MTVELIYDGDCPNVVDTRANILRAFSETHLSARWTEWDAASPDSPGRVRAFGSPTVLIDGRDITGIVPTGSGCCRLYIGPDGRQTGTPPVEMIRRALLKSGEARRTGLTRSLAVLPGIGVALLPKLTCPLCWPAYAGILSTLGLSFLLSANHLLTITALFLTLSVGSLAFRARGRHGYGPALIGIAASAAALHGKFQFNSTTTVYGGLALLATASIWNGWPRKAVQPLPAARSCGCGFPKTERKEKNNESRD